MTLQHALACALPAAVLALLLWRIGAVALRDLRDLRERAAMRASAQTTTHVCRNWHKPDETWVEVEETITAGGLELHRREVPSRVDGNHFLANSDGEHPDAAHVRCGRCYGSSFRIVFGSYSVSAHCVSCGLADEVYSG